MYNHIVASSDEHNTLHLVEKTSGIMNEHFMIVRSEGSTCVYAILVLPSKDMYH